MPFGTLPINHDTYTSPEALLDSQHLRQLRTAPGAFGFNLTDAKQASGVHVKETPCQGKEAPYREWMKTSPNNPDVVVHPNVDAVSINQSTLAQQHSRTSSSGTNDDHQFFPYETLSKGMPCFSQSSQRGGASNDSGNGQVSSVLKTKLTHVSTFTGSRHHPYRQVHESYGSGNLDLPRAPDPDAELPDLRNDVFDFFSKLDTATDSSPSAKLLQPASPSSSSFSQRSFHADSDLHAAPVMKNPVFPSTIPQPTVRMAVSTANLSLLQQLPSQFSQTANTSTTTTASTRTILEKPNKLTAEDEKIVEQLSQEESTLDVSWVKTLVVSNSNLILIIKTALEKVRDCNKEKGNGHELFNASENLHLLVAIVSYNWDKSVTEKNLCVSHRTIENWINKFRQYNNINLPLNTQIASTKEILDFINQINKNTGRKPSLLSKRILNIFNALDTNIQQKVLKARLKQWSSDKSQSKSIFQNFSWRIMHIIYCGNAYSQEYSGVFNASINLGVPRKQAATLAKDRKLYIDAMQSHLNPIDDGTRT